MLAALAIPALIPVLAALVALNALFPALGLDRRPEAPPRPGLIHLMAFIALVALLCFLDVPIVSDGAHWTGKAVVLGCDLGFAASVVGLRVWRRLSLLAWAEWCFVAAVVFTVASAFLAVSAFYTWGVDD